MADKTSVGDSPVNKSVPEREETLETGDNPIPAITRGEIGYTGLTVLGGEVFEECSYELRWPECIQTFKKMEKDGTIAPALELVEMMMSRVPWYVKVPEGYEEELEGKARFVRQNMDDMQSPWSTFIKQASTFNRYGFSVIEKVYRHRRKDRGSKYNDGLVGIKKLTIRSQDSVKGWTYSEDGRDLTGLVQEVSIPTGAAKPNRRGGFDYVEIEREGSTGTEQKFIPRKKFLLFRNNPVKDNPEGKSPLVSCWQAWKYKTAFQESEALSVAQDANGFKVLYLPARYLTEEATPEDKQAFEMYKRMMANAHQAKQSGFILPLLRDENGNKMFEFDVVNMTGGRSNDTHQIIARYTTEILVSLFADMLALGNSGGGSYSLSESKLTIVEMGIQAKLEEIKNQLNHDLIPQLFELNGWDTEVLPYFEYGEISKESIDELSKFFQRTAAVGLIPKTPSTINHVLSKGGFDYRVDEDMSLEELNSILTPNESRSGDGLASATGGLNGTGSNVSDGDNSISNNEA